MLNLAHTHLVEQAVDGIDGSAEARRRAGELIDRALDGEDTTQPVPPSEDEEARQNGQALQGLMGMLQGVQVAK